jgi:hypothetical protein
MLSMHTFLLTYIPHSSLPFLKPKVSKHLLKHQSKTVLSFLFLNDNMILYDKTGPKLGKTHN